jgi:hypothetical protein
MNYKEYFYSSKLDCVFFKSSTFQGYVTQEQILSNEVLPFNVASDLPEPQPEDLQQVSEAFYRDKLKEQTAKKYQHNENVLSELQNKQSIAQNELKKLGLSDQTINLLLRGN